MEKPTVFLSHSSLDKAPLIALKELLDNRAAGSLNFFLSSDGESIRFGRNWVVRISDALSQAKLMFVFLSPHSADSKWIHFEAGCAYAKDIQVVPVCLPGIDLNQIKPPLSLLQGFNLHSHEAMGNLARICNETLQMKINESFSREDFDNVVAKTTGRGAGFFGDQFWAIDAIAFSFQADLPANDYNPIPALHQMCKEAGIDCHLLTKGEPPKNCEAQLELPGCIVEFRTFEVRKRAKPAPGVQAGAGGTETVTAHYSIGCTLSPELFQMNAHLLDQWREQVRLAKPLSVNIRFGKQIAAERERHRLTTKLHQCDIHLAGDRGFEFEGLEFKLALSQWRGQWAVYFELGGKLEDERLRRLLERLFRSIVLWEHEPDLSEMY